MASATFPSSFLKQTVGPTEYTQLSTQSYTRLTVPVPRCKSFPNGHAGRHWVSVASIRVSAK